VVDNALAALNAYTVAALEVDGSESRTALPLGRTRASKEALDGRLGGQIEKVGTEPGVRQQL
jgi:hypothetical protein